MLGNTPNLRTKEEAGCGTPIACAVADGSETRTNSGYPVFRVPGRSCSSPLLAPELPLGRLSLYVLGSIGSPFAVVIGISIGEDRAIGVSAKVAARRVCGAERGRSGLGDTIVGETNLSLDSRGDVELEAERPLSLRSNSPISAAVGEICSVETASAESKLEWPAVTCS